MPLREAMPASEMNPTMLGTLRLCPLMSSAATAGSISAVGYAGAVAFVSHPVNAVLILLVLIVSGWHMHAGARVVVEDYFHRTLGRSALLVLNLFVTVLVTALAVFSVLKVALGGAL